MSQCSKPYIAFTDPYAQSIFLEGKEISHRYYIRCMCADYHIVRVNNPNPQLLVYERTSTTSVGFFIGKNIQTGEDKLSLECSVRMISTHSTLN